jgi:hypothetical protein
MSNTADYVSVNGNVTIKSRINSTFSAGILEIKGNLSQSTVYYDDETYGNSAFAASGTNKTVFSGTGNQTISFQTYDYSYINILGVNKSSGTLNSLSAIRIAGIDDVNTVFPGQP